MTPPDLTAATCYTFPMPPNLANARMHWAVKLRCHGEWKARAVVGDRRLRGRHRLLRRVRVTAVLYPRMRMDDDNAVARLKWCLDLLVERGIVVDDRRPYLELTGIPEQRLGSRPPRVELYVEAVA
jgi:hypothetical protein